MATVWNKFFESNYGFPVFQFYETDQPAYTQSCTGGENAALFDSSGFKKPILLYKRRSGMDQYKNNIAVTTLCPTQVQGETFNWITSGMIELNYEYFFAAGKEAADLRFTLMHEFGHLIGLDHSCEIGSGRSGMPDRQTTTLFSYLKAVMYPSSAKSELRNLGENDQKRTNCLYEEPFKLVYFF